MAEIGLESNDDRVGELNAGIGSERNGDMGKMVLTTYIIL